MSDDELRKSELGLGLSEDIDVIKFDAEAQAVQTLPGKVPTTPGEWIKQNLFSGWVNSLLTIVSALIIGVGGYNLVNFVFVSAEWRVIQVGMRGYMIGKFPFEEVWRIWASLYLVALLAGLSWGMAQRPIVWTRRKLTVAIPIAAFALLVLFYTTKTFEARAATLGSVAILLGAMTVGRVLGPRLRRPMIFAWLLAFPVVMVIVRGFGGVPPRLWGGFFFNIIAATVGIFVSFPIGIFLAIGRKSRLVAMRLVSVVFIEIFRGVPLVAWLIFSKFVVDLLLPPNMEVADIIKAFIAMTLFSAAYVGEIVRGGLQGVHAGQYEAARALGLSTPRMMAFVIMPQALRSTIPAMISHFISLFKDTSLFVAIEVTELLEATRRSAASLEFLGKNQETLLFAALLFWVVAFSMSRWSQRLEVRLGVGER